MDGVLYFMFRQWKMFSIFCFGNGWCFIFYVSAMDGVLYFMLAIGGDISSPDSQTWPEQHSVPGGWRAWHKTQVGIINVSEMGGYEGFNHHDPQ